MKVDDLRELELMRNKLVARMEELFDQESNGVITSEQRIAQLEQEFSKDYMKNLCEINDILTHRKKRTNIIPHAPLAGFLFFSIVSLLILSALVYPGVTGAVVKQNVDSNIFLLNGQSHPLEVKAKISEVEIDLEYVGPGKFTLYLHDESGTHELVSGTASNYDCSGCAGNYKPPYMLEAKTGGGSINVNKLRYKSSGIVITK